MPSKILEHIIFKQLLSHLSNSQFGFNHCSSTQETLIAATNSWHQYLDEKQSVGAVFFDLSKAFDSVPHSDILRALTRIRVTGWLHTWFADYLSDHMQSVVLIDKPQNYQNWVVGTCPGQYSTWEFLFPVTSPGQPTLTPYVAKPNCRLDCCIGTSMLEVHPLIKAQLYKSLPFLTIALPFLDPN